VGLCACALGIVAPHIVLQYRARGSTGTQVYRHTQKHTYAQTYRYVLSHLKDLLHFDHEGKSDLELLLLELESIPTRVSIDVLALD